MRKFVGYVALVFAALMFVYGIFGSTPGVPQVAHFMIGWILAAMFMPVGCWLLKVGKEEPEEEPEVVTVNTSAVIHKQLVCKNCGGSEIESVKL